MICIEFKYSIPLDPQKLEVYLSLNQPRGSVAESDAPLRVLIKLSGIASEDVPVEVTISDRSANGKVE